MILNVYKQERKELIIDKSYREIWCHDNQLTELEIPEEYSKELTNFVFSRNRIKEIQIPESVTHLEASYNLLTKLILPKNVYIVRCFNNEIGYLQVSASCKFLYCNINPITELKLPMWIEGVTCDLMDKINFHDCPKLKLKMIL